ncbi:MAG: hypothetical protein K8E24_010915 [Methanobacterium paludis]|nr:hypothetical protein [Methanobacterium paludis]
MIESQIGKLIFLIFIVICGAFPLFSTNSSAVSQTVSIEVPETNAISTGSGDEDFSTIKMGNLSPDNGETTFKGMYIKSFSNTNTELWVRASGDFVGQKTSQKLDISNLGFDVSGTNEKTSFSSSYIKVNGLDKSDESIFLNFYFRLPYGTAPDTYTTTVYLISVPDTPA